MSRPLQLTYTLGLAWLTAARLAAQAPQAAEGDTSPPHAAPAPAPAAPADPAARAQPAFKLGGYAEASYAYSGRAVGSTIVGRLYDRYSDQFTLNALKLAVDRPFATDKWDAGAHADILVGKNAPLVQSSGFSLGADGDITQLYVVLNVPTPNGNGLQLKLGKFVTLMGLEVIEDVANPTWSEGNQFVYVENFTGTGVEADYKFGKYADAQLRLCNGWDRVIGNAGHKDFMARLGLYPGAATSLGLVGYVGAQESNSDATRYGVDALLSQKVGAVSVWLQGDVGREQANPALPDSTRDATWWALGGWAAYDVAPKLGVALRADYLDDTEGARTSAAFALPPGGLRHKLWSATATLNIRSWPSVLVRPELRYDHSNLTPFDGKQAQLSVALSAAYLY